jgi:hypothetical protein
MKDTQFNSFVDLLSVFPGNSRQREILIRLNYFSEFGGSLKLLKISELYDKYYGKKIIKKEKCDLPIEVVAKYAESETEKQYRFSEDKMLEMLGELCGLIPNEDLPLMAQISAQKEYLGYVDMTDPARSNTAIVMDLNTKYSTFRAQLYRLSDGQTTLVKLKKKNYEQNPVVVGQIINYRIESKPGWTKLDNGEWKQDYSKTDLWLSHYSIE